MVYIYLQLNQVFQVYQHLLHVLLYPKKINVCFCAIFDPAIKICSYRMSNGTIWSSLPKVTRFSLHSTIPNGEKNCCEYFMGLIVTKSLCPKKCSGSLATKVVIPTVLGHNYTSMNKASEQANKGQERVSEGKVCLSYPFSPDPWFSCISFWSSPTL